MRDLLDEKTVTLQHTSDPPTSVTLPAGLRLLGMIGRILRAPGHDPRMAASLIRHLACSVGTEFVLIATVVIWCAAWGLAAFRLARWPCPRCGIAWLSSQEVRLGASRRCGKCGLGLYEKP